MAEQYGPGGQDPQGGSQNNNTYHYNYSYGSGRGTTPPGGHKPPRNSNDWGEWVGIGFLLLIMPFWFCKIIGVVWLLNKLGKMTASDKRRYKQEAREAANRARNTAASFFQQTADAAQRGANAARQAADNIHQSTSGTQKQGQSAPSGTTYHYSYKQSAQSQQKKQAEPWEQKSQPDTWNQSESGRKKARKKAGGGTGLIVGGSVLAAIFGLVVFVLGIIGAVENVAEMVIPIGICLPFLAGGIGMLFSGISKNRRSERYLNYLAYIGANREVDLAPMAASSPMTNASCSGPQVTVTRVPPATGPLDAGPMTAAKGARWEIPSPRRWVEMASSRPPPWAAARADAASRASSPLGKTACILIRIIPASFCVLAPIRAVRLILVVFFAAKGISYPKGKEKP